MGVLNHQDRIGGLVLLALGVAVTLYSQRWGMGTPARVGPGAMPTVLGVLLAGTGAAMLVTSMHSERKLPPFAWRPAVFILGSTVLFALLIGTLGLIPASLITVVVASFSDRTMSWAARLALAVAVTIIVLVIFKWALGMLVPLWWFG